MNSSTTRILSDVLVLSSIERAELIDKLLRSFDPPEDTAVADAWTAEVESRIDVYEAGKVSADSDEAVFARINNR